MSGSGLHVEFFNVQIVLAGPRRSEEEARRRLVQILYEGFAEGYDKNVVDPDGTVRPAWEGLSECDYLHFSGMAEREAEKIMKKVQYRVKGRKIVIGIAKLDVTYQNTGKPTKWWARIRNGVQTIEPGDLY